jgi:hypothetical protein
MYNRPNVCPIPVKTDVEQVDLVLRLSVSEIATLILSMSLNFIKALRNDRWYNKRVLIWRFTLVLIKINSGQIGDQTGLQMSKAFSWSGWKDPLNFLFLCEFK